MPTRVVGTAGFDTLVPLLTDLGYTVIAPTVREQTITYDRIESADEFPIGWTDHQGPGSYELARRDDEAYFGYTVGPRTIKHYLFPPRQTLLTITSAATGLAFAASPQPAPRYAFVGVRPCELAGIDIQDTVFADTPFADPDYVSRRERSFTVAVNCAVAGATCFCTSMDTGPQATSGYDLAVTEVLDGDRHVFVVTSGSDEGDDVLTSLDGRDATPADLARVEEVVADTRAQITRSMPADEARDLLADRFDDPIWDDIAERCLSCTNCTLVCPTCFCNTMEDATDLAGTATRSRRWDSCFNREFTYLHGHAVRSSTKSRYRQWMTHKLSYWYDQFGSSGCVGCGRCITWCPVGIDITTEVGRMRTEAEVMA